MVTKRVAVVRGGPSAEYDISMNTGQGVLQALTEIGYSVKDIVVTKRGEWLIDGLVKTPDVALMTTDTVFIAMHGAYGEDGTIQKIFERFHVPFTGSNSFPSTIAFNKDLTKRALRDLNLNLPRHVLVQRDSDTQIAELVTAIRKSFGPRYVIKPTTSGSSHGVVMVNSPDDLANAIHALLASTPECMVEERITGTEATCGVLENFRGEAMYAFPPIEIIPPAGHDFFSADVKYTGETTEICPGRFSFSEREKILATAVAVHQALGLSQYSRSDFIVKDGEIYFLEVNTLPGLTPNSLFPKAAAAVGLSFNELVDHLVATATVR